MLIRIPVAYCYWYTKRGDDGVGSAGEYASYQNYKAKEKEYKKLADDIEDKLDDIEGYTYAFDDIVNVHNIMNNSLGEDVSKGVMIDDYTTAMNEQITSFGNLKNTMKQAITGLKSKVEEARERQEYYRQQKDAAYARYEAAKRAEEEERRRRAEEEAERRRQAALAAWNKLWG